MKRKREGRLHEPVYTSSTGDDFHELITHSLPAFADLDDFMLKATRLARQVDAPADSLRAEYASKLSRGVARLRRWIRSGTNRGALDDAVSTALALSALCEELRDDAKTRPVKSRSGKVMRGKITRSTYLSAKRVARNKKAAMRLILGVSEKGLRDWERENLS